MSPQLSPLTVRFLFFCISCYRLTSSTLIQPTVINATGEYYIADAFTFSNNFIHCNSTHDCYIICPIEFSCSNTMITCSSSICNLDCTDLEACHNTEFIINTDPVHTNSSVDVFCTDLYACYNTHIHAVGSTNASSTFTLSTYSISDTSTLINSTFIIQDFTSVNINHNSDDSIANTYRLHNVSAVNILKKGDNSYGYNVSGIGETFIIHDSNAVHMTCSGSNACTHYRLWTSHSPNSRSSSQTKTTIDCLGHKACHNLDVVQSEYDTLELLCINGEAVCLGASLLISPQSAATQITCNGTKNSHSCNDINITVPFHHHPTFLNTIFMNHDAKDTMPHIGSFDRVRVRCLDHKLCTNYTSFPLLYGAASSSNKTRNNKVYFAGSVPYEYQFKSISCEDGEECFIDCKGQMCPNTFIQCNKGSVCHIYCPGAYDCDHITLQAFSDNVELECGATNACYDANIWLPSSFHNGFLNISTCNKYESCNLMEFMCGDNNNFISSEFKFSDGRYLCKNELCCPWNTIANDTLKCTQNNCVIDCHNEWGNPYAAPIGCKSLVIDGTASNYLTVNCSSAGHCVNVTVLCPSGSCDIHCGEGSCVNSTIVVKYAKIMHMYCMDSRACSGTNITSYDVVQLTLNCSDAMSCDDVNIFSNIATNMDIKCNANRSCHRLYIDSNSVHNLDLVCNKAACVNSSVKGTKNGNVSLQCTDSGGCSALRMDMEDVNNVDIMCRNHSCLHNVINVNHVANSVNLKCVDAHACSWMDFSAKHVTHSVAFHCLNSYSCSDNIFEADYVNDSVNVICNGQYSCRGSLDAQHSNRLNIHKYSTGYYGNYAMNMKAPRKSGSIYLYCKQYGCNVLHLNTMNGLSDAHAKWSGSCHSDNIMDYVTTWNISCGEGDGAQYEGTFCSGNDKCCSQKDVDRIQKAFDQYYYYGNGNTSNACAIPPHNEPSHAGRAAAIIISIIVILLIGCVAYNWYQQTDCWKFICFLIKQKMKRPREMSEEYMSINSVN